MPSAPAINTWRLYVVMLTTTKPRGRNLPETVGAKDVQSRASVGSYPRGGEHLRQFAGSGIVAGAPAIHSPAGTPRGVSHQR